MKRRDFIGVAAGLGAGAMMAGTAKAADQPEEAPLQLYKCKVCDAIVQVMQPGSASLKHCGQPMELMVEKTEDKGAEKHVPVIEKIEGGYKVKVGEVPHPMTESHLIVGIQLICEDGICTKALKPGDKPEAVFKTDGNAVTARAYCNLHGLWKNK